MFIKFIYSNFEVEARNKQQQQKKVAKKVHHVKGLRFWILYFRKIWDLEYGIENSWNHMVSSSKILKM